MGGIQGQSIIGPGEFKYKSPCPPNSKHRYEWTTAAKLKNPRLAAQLKRQKRARCTLSCTAEPPNKTEAAKIIITKKNLPSRSVIIIYKTKSIIYFTFTE